MTEMARENQGKQEKLRREKFFALAVLLAAILIAAAWKAVYREPGAWAVVTVDGEETARYSLSQNTAVQIEGWGGGSNTLVIEAGGAHIINASCPDHICEKQGTISRAGETITCLPNRVMIVIRADEGTVLDGVAE